ncbi:DNA mismatch repair endonuclease MutL [Blattabacterium sp. (Cryptocercus kyebangensis)]|uniref:DNA mismatch repair endonuclease MutL n=1 Tax=Blattabacterium sp. (Cryptocercus kyebangensis) TaxID=298656 RepID=UPI000D7BEA34|nr:DNA mismatch repair endonuclease MutL [Blattabacterium sp. (Cryptocercus kyebangensis)]AWU43920.1 DNA mismatch repair endonuclease MutL [Blattabacterium sp. (Cryptocercus kyebangensis)]
MKDIIQFLPKKVINQIAAGEVIQRPSSVLKELLENSIDAKSKSIDIFIRDSGKTLIQLIDNGEGMSYNDARNSFQRYATSKIKTNEDIFRINTKGFRGEALASIAFISKLEIQTKNQENIVGIHILVEEGKIKEQIPINMLRGTRISVKNIFSKFPARRRFLKSSRIEFKHIINEFYKIILAHRDIVYRFYHNDKIIYFFKKASLKERIKEIFIKRNKTLLPILIKKNKIIIEGFISEPDFSVKKGDQFLFVNQRCITNTLLHRRIIHSYEGLLKDLKTVSYFIFINIDPILVNWNIHPTKKEIKLEEEDQICNLIQQEIKNVLCCQYKVKKEELKNSDLLLSFNSSVKKESFLLMNYYDSFFDKFSYKEKVTQLENWFHKMKESHFFLDVHLTKKLSNYIYHEKKIKTFQMNGKYIIFLWNNENIILVDQHRAHQNILFEFFFKERKKKLISQQLLFPIEVKLLDNEFISLKNIQYELIEMGFHLYFWNKSAYLYSIPENIHQNILVEIFQNILTYNFINGEKNNKKILIKSVSKSAAVKYGTELHSDKMECLIRDFFSCKNINYTYSGDPIFFIFNKNFLKKTIL